MADSKRFLPLPPYLRFLLDVPSVANAEIGSQTTIMAMGNKDKDKKEEDEKAKKVEKKTDDTPSPNPEPPRDPMTNLPFDILGELFDIAKQVEKESGTGEVEEKVEVKVEEKKPYTVSYTVTGKPITDFDLANEVAKLPTAELEKQKREYLYSFNSPTSWASPQRWKTALANVKEMPQDLSVRDLISKKWNSKLDINTRRMHLAHARLDAIINELNKRETPMETGEQSELVNLYDLDEENKKQADLKQRLSYALSQLKFFESRNMDQEANEIRKEIDEFKKKNNI